LSVLSVRGVHDGVEKYSEDQPRDDHGRWTACGRAGAAPARQSEPSSAQLLDKRTRTLADHVIAPGETSPVPGCNTPDNAQPSDSGPCWWATPCSASSARRWEGGALLGWRGMAGP